VTEERATDGFLEEVVDRCVERLAKGESLDAVLASYPGHAAELRAILAPARVLMTAPVPAPGRAAQSMALNSMLSAVQAAQARPGARNFVLLWLGSLKARPLAYQMLAITGAALVFGGVTLGAAAATGSTPTPVRRILGISADSQHKVVLKGTIAALSNDALTLRVDGAAAMDLRTIALAPSTTFTRGARRIASGDLRIGDVVEVDAAQSGDRIEARVVRARDDDAPAAGATNAAGDDGAGAERSPAATSGTQVGGARDGTGTPGSKPGDERTPAPGATTRPAETPVPGGDDGRPHDGAPTPGSTAKPADPKGDRTPEATSAANATEQPQATRSAEATPKPEQTKTPEPTETRRSGSESSRTTTATPDS